ncbi:hypothetical protein EP7_004296 [Isosphaeraceae bacterium EP7]
MTSKLYRELGGNVVLQHGATALRFFPKAGGAILQAYRDGCPPLLREHAGAAFQTAFRVGGNDPTVGGSNASMGNPIACFGMPETQRYNYTGRETLFDTLNYVYEITQFAPFYWSSEDSVDDAPAPNADGSRTGWFTSYDPGRYTNDVNSSSRPIIFEGRPGCESGLFFVGDERTLGQPFGERLAEIQGGRFALKIRPSFFTAHANAFAGVVFRKSVPRDARTKDDAYRAPGIHFNFNRAGGWEALRSDGNGPQVSLGKGQFSIVNTARLNSAGGLPMEIQTHNGIPGLFWVMIDGVEVARVFDPAKLSGPHLGVFAQTPTGAISFNDRAPYHVGVEVVSRWAATFNGIVSDIRVRCAPGVNEPHKFDRANLPAAFLSWETFPPGDRRVYAVSSANDRTNLPPGVSYLLSGAYGYWAGNSAGTAGLYSRSLATVDGKPSSGAHIMLDTNVRGEFVTMINPLPEGVVTEASELRVQTIWQTSLFD